MPRSPFPRRLGCWLPDSRSAVLRGLGDAVVDFQVGREAGKAVRQLIPLIKPDASAEGVAALCAGLAGLVLHIQKLSGIARESWKGGQGQGRGAEVTVVSGGGMGLEASQSQDH